MRIALMQRLLRKLPFLLHTTGLKMPFVNPALEFAQKNYNTDKESQAFLDGCSFAVAYHQGWRELYENN